MVQNYFFSLSHLRRLGLVIVVFYADQHKIYRFILLFKVRQLGFEPPPVHG